MSFDVNDVATDPWDFLNLYPIHRWHPSDGIPIGLQLSS